jgi:tRNA splicing endonuclease
MTAIQLKKDLAHRIYEIQDTKELKFISDFIVPRYKSVKVPLEQDEEDSIVLCDDGTIKLSSEMNQFLEIASNHVKKGNFKTHEQVMAEADQWILEKK